jgi:hypothetical protein
VIAAIAAFSQCQNEHFLCDCSTNHSFGPYVDLAYSLKCLNFHFHGPCRTSIKPVSSLERSAGFADSVLEKIVWVSCSLRNYLTHLMIPDLP